MRHGLLPVLAGLLLAASPAAGQPHLFREVRVLCIGVEEYQDRERINPVAFGLKDARAVGTLLGEGYGFAIVPLLGEAATRANILAALEKAVADLKSNDVLIVYFAGHGHAVPLDADTTEGFLLPYDARINPKTERDPKVWRERTIPMRTLLQVGTKTEARHVLFLVDACCSGLLTQRGDLLDRLDLEAILARPSRMVLSATTGSDPALPDRNRQHGYFTAALLAALTTARDEKSALSVNMLFDRVREDVSKASGKTQLPQAGKVSNHPGEFVFLPKGIPADDVDDLRQRIDDLRDRLKHPDKTVSRDPLQRGAFREVQQYLARTAREAATLSDVLEAFEAADFRHALDADARHRQWQLRRAHYEKLARQGDPLAMASLHYCLSKGLGGPIDKDGAFRWAKQAAEKESIAGLHVLGRCEYLGIGTDRDELPGLDKIRRAADANFPIGRITLGYEAAKKKETIATARDHFERAIRAGLDFARVSLARTYLDSPGATLDRDRARNLLLPAAEKGIAEAQFLLARVLADHFARTDVLHPAERWLDADARAADHWLREAARNGHVEAQERLLAALIPEAFFKRLPSGRWYATGEHRFAVTRADDPREEMRRWADVLARHGNGLGFVVQALLAEEARQVADAETALKKGLATNHPGAWVLRSLWHLDGGPTGKKNSALAYEDALRAVKEARAQNGHRAEAYLNLSWVCLKVPEDTIPERLRSDGSVLHHAHHFEIQAALLGSKAALHLVLLNEKPIPDLVRVHQKMQADLLRVYPDSYRAAKQLVQVYEK